MATVAISGTGPRPQERASYLSLYVNEPLNIDVYKQFVLLRFHSENIGHLDDKPREFAQSLAGKFAF